MKNIFSSFFNFFMSFYRLRALDQNVVKVGPTLHNKLNYLKFISTVILKLGLTSGE